MTKGKTIGYVRVSTEDQNPDRQLADIKVDKLFTEYASGTKIERYQLNCLMDYIREDDIVYVHSMDRLARNVKHLLELVEQITAKGAKLHFIKENLCFSGDDSPGSKLLLTMMGAVAQFEIYLLRERQMEGIKIAKAQGKYKGRQTVLTPTRIEYIHDALKTRKSLTQIAFEVGICRATLQKYVKKLEEEGHPLGVEYKKQDPECHTRLFSYSQ